MQYSFRNTLFCSKVIFLTFILTVVVTSCGGNGDDAPLTETLYPISVGGAAISETAAITRADDSKNLARDFILYGYKNVGGIEQVVFNGYTVKYKEGSANTSEDNTNNYSYVDGEKNQTIKYWDFSASEYHFWAVSALSSDYYTFTGDGGKHNVLTITDMPLRAGGTDPDDVLYSLLTERRPVSREMVLMQFKRPYAKVRIQFYTNEPINGEKDNVTIEDITFGPDKSAVSPLVNEIYGTGNVKITYPLTNTLCPGSVQETLTLEHLDNARDELSFDNITLTSTQGISSNTAVTAPVKASIDPDNNSFYYLLPMGDMNPAFIMKAKIDPDIDATQRTAVVPANFMQWKPNFTYTYIFKITAGANIEFYDVKIDPWHYGGSQEDEWKNW